MILSMTGYGDAQLMEDGVGYALEIRSLNNRYLKPSIKLPEHLQFLEPEVDKLLRNRLVRGTLNYTLRVRDTSAQAAYEINVAALQAYLNQLNSVHPTGPVSVDLATVLALPGVCQPPEMDEAAREHQLKVVSTLTNEALDKLIAMRAEEGRALRDDLLKHTAAIRQELAAIAERSPAVVAEYLRRLTQRVNDLIGQAKLQLAEQDLAKEVALFAERCDVSEEIARLKSHLDQFDRLCDSKQHAGRKLDFLAQEMLREANTIGSKSNDAEIARHIVEIKALIDRLKEQVQNVE
jgi:uncharacterized protein (TIGR00255 family)